MVFYTLNIYRERGFQSSNSQSKINRLSGFNLFSPIKLPKKVKNSSLSAFCHLVQRGRSNFCISKVATSIFVESLSFPSMFYRRHNIGLNAGKSINRIDYFWCLFISRYFWEFWVGAWSFWVTSTSSIKFYFFKTALVSRFSLKFNAPFSPLSPSNLFFFKKGFPFNFSAFVKLIVNFFQPYDWLGFGKFDKMWLLKAHFCHNYKKRFKSQSCCYSAIGKHSMS